MSTIDIKATPAEKVATSEKIMKAIVIAVKDNLKHRNVVNTRTDGRPFFYYMTVNNAFYGKWFVVVTIYSNTAEISQEQPAEANAENAEATTSQEALRHFKIDAYQSYTAPIGSDNQEGRGMFHLSSNNPADVSIYEYTPFFFSQLDEGTDEMINEMSDDELAKYLNRLTLTALMNVGDTIHKFGKTVTRCSTFIPEGEFLGQTAIDKRYISQKSFVPKDLMRSADKRIAYDLVGKKINGELPKEEIFRYQV